MASGGNSAELLRNSLPRLRLGHITSDKRKIKDFRKIACRHLVARRYTPLQKKKIRKLFIYPHLSKSQEEKNK